MLYRSTPFLFAASLTIIGCGNAPEATVATPEPQPVTQEVPQGDALLVRFGSSHGMCTGYCTQEFELKEDGLLARRKGGGRGDISAYPDQEQLVALDKASIEAARAAFDAAAFDAAPDVIGCPDCADGGRCWVEVVRNGRPRLVTFDCTSGSEQLKGFTDALWKLSEQVQWPEGAPADH